MKGMIDLLIFLKLNVLSQKREYLFYNLIHFIFHLVKNPVIVTCIRQNARIFKINKVTGRFGLCEVQDLFQIGNAHFAVLENQVQNSQPRFVGTCLENLGAERQIEIFEPHINFRFRTKVID